MPRTYAPDNGPVEVTAEGAGVRAVQPVEASTGIQKEMAVRLAESGSAVEVTHRLTNRNPWPVELSPWALTMMAPGGVSVTGFPPRGRHPEVLPPRNKP